MEIQTKKFLKYFIAPLLVALLLTGFYHRQETRDWLLHVKFYQIGQGDAFLITTYEGNQILVDGGPGDNILEKLAVDMGIYDKTIEMIVLTHAHLDHFEGLIAVLSKYEVKKILMPQVKSQSDPYQSFLNAANDENAQIIYAVQGQRIYLDNATVLDILHPDTSELIDPGKNGDINDTSIVAMLRFGKTKVLLTGDAGTNIEDKLLPLFDLNADILKVGHHGSKHSTSEKFLAEVTPEYSVIQVGKNKYGHPTPEIIARLEQAKSGIFRTDKENDVEFVSNGTTIKVGQ